MEFLKNREYFLKMQAIKNYKHSKRPIEQLEFRLNKLIGPNKLK